jgi:hypothetical protein
VLGAPARRPAALAEDGHVVDVDVVPQEVRGLRRDREGHVREAPAHLHVLDARDGRALEVGHDVLFAEPELPKASEVARVEVRAESGRAEPHALQDHVGAVGGDRELIDRERAQPVDGGDELTTAA